MKCLFVTASMQYGGAERVMSILMNEWSKQGIESRILITGSTGISYYPLEKGITVLSCYKEGKRFNQLEIIRTVHKQCAEWKPDVIISFFNDLCALTSIAIYGQRVPLVYSERNDPNKTNQRIIDRLYRKIVERNSTFFVFQTRGAQRYYPQHVQRRSCILFNPVDINMIPQPCKGSRTKRIVTVGRLTQQKNQKMLINAFAAISDKIPEYRLEIYGDGILRNELQEQINALPCFERISLMGTSDKVLLDINDAAMFVLTSNYEGMPNALVEAMCMGLPCISTDCSPGGAAEIIANGENGIIIPCGDSKALSKVMYDLVQNNVRAALLGECAARIRSKVAAKDISVTWMNIIDSVQKNFD